MNRSPILTRSDIFDLIAAGGLIVIKDNAVLRLDDWVEKHPGGRLAILHMVGRDATDEITISHSASTLRGIARFRIGYVEDGWKNFTPPIQGGCFSQPSSQDDLQGQDLFIDHDAVKTGDSKASPSVARNEKESLTPFGDVSLAVQKDIDDSIRSYPSLDADTQREITTKYQALHERIKAEGFYTCDYRRYGIECIRYAALFAGFLAFLRYGWYAPSAICLGLFWHQIMFTAHDAGHRGITHNFVLDTLIGIFIGDFCCGLSIGWWKSSHNVHHLVTNQPEHDPDIQNVPLFAISPDFLRTMRSSYYDFTFIYDAFGKVAVQYQAFSYYPVMAVARFNLYFLSWAHLLNPRTPNIGRAAWTRPTEIASIAAYFIWYGYLITYLCIPTWRDRVIFVLISHLITMPLHVQITLSHWGMPTCDLPGECFAQHQLRTTMDVDCPVWLDFIHGGLQFQAVHHLFPRVPRHNLRNLQPYVREFCEQTGIKYSILGFTDGNKKVLGRLGEVGKQAMLMAKCQAHMAVTGESGLN